MAKGRIKRVGAVCTTLSIEGGVPRFLPLHLQRLQYFAKRLALSFCASSIGEQVRDAARDMGDGVLRIELNPDGVVALTPRSMPLKRSLKWAVVKRKELTHTGFKQVDRSHWNSIKKELSVDVLVLQSEEGRYLECCIGNLFVYRPSKTQWLTPSLNEPILPGIARSVLLSQAKVHGIDILETCVYPQVEDQLWMSNAVRGLVPLSLATDSTPPPLWTLFEQESQTIHSLHKHFQHVLHRANYGDEFPAK